MKEKIRRKGKSGKEKEKIWRLGKEEVYKTYVLFFYGVFSKNLILVIRKFSMFLSQGHLNLVLHKNPYSDVSW